ncbi:c-type cytochrome [Cupriavidus basilensis]
MEESNKSRWIVAGVLALGAAVATFFALQTKRYLEAPVAEKQTTEAGQLRIDASDSVRVTRGRQLYTQACASCHGAKLEGQANWREGLCKRPHAGTPANLGIPGTCGGAIRIAKNGLIYRRLLHRGYLSDMPAWVDSICNSVLIAVSRYIQEHLAGQDGGSPTRSNRSVCRPQLVGSQACVSNCFSVRNAAERNSGRTEPVGTRGGFPDDSSFAAEKIQSLSLLDCDLSDHACFEMTWYQASEIDGSQVRRTARRARLACPAQP